MRNLQQYPITLEEKLKTLDLVIQRELDRIKEEKNFGSIIPSALYAVKADVERLADLDD